MAEPIAWDTALDAYAQALQLSDHAQRTVASYLSDIRALRQWLETRGAEGATSPATVTVASLAAFWAADHQVRPGVDRARTSRDRRKHALTQFFLWTVEQGWRTDTPWPPTSVLRRGHRPPPPPPTYLTGDEVLAPLTAARQGRPGDPAWVGLRDMAFFTVLATLGLRLSEACGLTIQDWVEAKPSQALRVTGKGGKVRLLPLREETWLAWAAWHERRPSTTTDAAFCNLAGTGPISPRSAERRIHAYAAAAGIHKTTGTVTPHKLRHSYATALVRQGLNLREVQELLGHAHLNTTEIYTHVVAKELSDHVRRVTLYAATPSIGAAEQPKRDPS